MIKPKSGNKRWQASVLGLIALAALAIVAAWAGITHNSPVYAATTVFDDEFNGTSLDTNAWVAMNRPGDTSNAEQQCYKPGNVSFDGANLVILTKQDSSCAGYSYTSAMVQWKTFNFTYGYVEVRAKLPGGQGPWPTIWFLGANCQQTNVTDPGNIPPCNWPQPGSDEIDMTEILGSNHTNINQQIHSGSSNPGCGASVSDVSQNWHTYGMNWTAGSVIWTVDGTATCTVTSAVPSTPMFLMLNTALGGAGGGTINAGTLPQSFFIDYVRVTQGTLPPAPAVSTVAPSSGLAAGGTPVTITGTDLSGATAVKFGTAAATVTANTATQIVATSPPGTGTVDVRVTTPSGTSAINAADKFTYTALPAPMVTMLAPTTGPASGGTPVTITGTNLTGATAVKFGTNAGTAVIVNSATQITATSPAGSGIVDVAVTTPGGTSAISAADRFTFTLPQAAYTAVTPVRLLDTRNSGGPVGAGGVRNLTVAAGTPGAPAGASAVVLNVTVTNTSAASFLTVYPAGAARPLASSMNWAAGKTIAGLVTVQVGGGGAITLFNGVGSTDLVVDFEGYFAAPSGSAGGEVALTPARITDTRAGSGKPNAGNTLGVAGTITVQVAGAGRVPASGASAAILNVTATNTTAAGALTVWPTGATRPLASNLNWLAGQTVPNRVLVPIGSGGQVSIFNFAGSTDVVVDVSGYFTDATASGKLFTSVSPLRLVDTRLTGQTLSTGGSFTLPVGGVAGVPVGASAVILNVTVTNTSAPGFLVVYPSTVGLPLASDLNWVGGQTVANMAVASLGTTGAITFFNGVGSSDVVVDLAGWFS